MPTSSHVTTTGPSELPGPALVALLRNELESNPDKSLVETLDEALGGGGEFAELIAASSIFFLVRRMIHFGRYRLRILEGIGQEPETLRGEISDYLTDKLKLPLSFTQRSKVEALVYDCVMESKKKLSPAQKAAAIARGRAAGKTNCYICGRELDFTPLPVGTKLHEALSHVEVEHQFPRSLGGTNREPNLWLSCACCNNAKTDFLGYADFHYERISTSHHENEDDFAKELEIKTRVAVILAGAQKCAGCNISAEDAGGLYVGRQDTDDSWHFLNLRAYCSSCHPEDRTPYSQ